MRGERTANRKLSRRSLDGHRGSLSALRSGPESASELAESLKIEFVTVSHHLGILHPARLVQKKRKGRFILYSLHEGVFQPTGSSRDKEHIDLGCCRLEVPKE